MEETPQTEEEVLTNPEVEESTDEPTEEQPVEEEPEVEEPEQPSPEPEEAQPSRREQLRIAQILQKYGPPKTSSEQPEALDYAEALNADPETIKTLQADRESYANSKASSYQKQLESNIFHTRLEIDAPRVEAKFPQIDKSSDQFDPAVADALNTHYLHLVGYDPQTNTVANPNLRYADFVEAQFELGNRIASRRASETSKNIAKQAATTGIRPDGSSAKKLNLSKDPSQMTDEELNAVISQALPK